MKKITILLLLSVLISGSVYSQSGTVFNKFQNRKSQDRSKAIIIGFKGGLNLASMSYTDDNLKDLPKNTLLQPLFGLFVEVPVTDKISVAPELSMVNRGVSISYTYRNNTNLYPEGTPVNYDIDSKYFDFRLPVEYHLTMSKKFQPYAFIAPDFAFLLGGTIKLDQDVEIPGDNPIDISKANMRGLDVSAIAGIGTRMYINFTSFSLLLKLEAGYNFGFINTMSQREYDEETIANNVNAYNISTKRFNRGCEFAIYIGLPLKFAEKGCSDFGNARDRFY